MIYRAAESTVLATNQELLDDNDDPLLCKPGYPKVALLDKEGFVLSSILANPSSKPGLWLANLAIPHLKLTASIELTVRWRVRAIDGATYSYKDVVIVEPQIDVRDTDVVTLYGDANFTFKLPTTLNAGDKASYQLYYNNVAVLPDPINIRVAPVKIDSSGVEALRITAPLEVVEPSLYSTLLKVDIERTGVTMPSTYIYKLWALTPQLYLAMSHLDDFINKSRIENTIPELRYTTGDLIVALERGLEIFNSIFQPTGFSGLNMQGALFDAHLICAQYYAISSQLLAEGSLAFDFSGQGISLNVDRTPQLEAALGRMESLMDSRIVPLKKELVKNGHLGGDGSVGGTAGAGANGLNNPYNKGSLGVINAATTKIYNPQYRFLGRRR